MNNQSQDTNSGNDINCIFQNEDNKPISQSELLRKERISSIVNKNSVKSLSEQTEEQSKIKRDKERKERKDNNMKTLPIIYNAINTINETLENSNELEIKLNKKAYQQYCID
jgi:hypothetical protein